MYTHADKTQENKSQSVANGASQKQTGGESSFQFVDNRPEAIAQRKLQETANNSPQVMQLRAFQEMANDYVIQQKPLAKNKLNVVGESHPDYKPTKDPQDPSKTLPPKVPRAKEEEYAKAMLGSSAVYNKEGDFKTSTWAFQDVRYGDPMLLRAEMLLAMIKDQGIPKLKALNWDGSKVEMKATVDEAVLALRLASHEKAEQEEASKAEATHNELVKLSPNILINDHNYFVTEIQKIIKLFAKDVLGIDDIRSEGKVNELRSSAMQGSAADNARRWTGEQIGVWKVGNTHVPEIQSEKKTDKYELMDKDDFNADFLPWLEQNS